MTSEIWLGLLSGIAFGFVIQRAGATNAHKMALAHLMIDADIPRFMLMAVALSAVGLLGLQLAGVGRMLIIPTSLVATGVAGVLFGIGWGLCGYCPGTIWAAAGEGRMGAVFALLGGLAGSAAFADLHEILIPILYGPTNVGQITLVDWFGSKPLAVAVLTAVLAVSIWVIGAIWGKDKHAAFQ